MFSNQPLAERLRPKNLDGYFGQPHLVGNDSVLRKIIESGNLPSFILWGPPGVGKTTLAVIIANQLKRPFYRLSAVNSGVKEVRECIEKARNDRFLDQPNPLLFIDEIHRFSKSQQDSLLGAVEQGVITLIGATTENPSFEVIAPLLSRCQVFILKPLDDDVLRKMIGNALSVDYYLSKYKVVVEEDEALIRLAGGDARKLYNALELTVSLEADQSGPGSELKITNQKVLDHVQKNLAMYDKHGEMHYDIISAFIKSVRGSDPNAAVYYLARMVEGGEDVKFIARRLVILAAEDIGLANPNALMLAQSAFDAVNAIGWPESRIILSEITIYLATSPKSNSAYMAINKAQEEVYRSGDLSVPLHLRNAPTKLMKKEGYGKDYKYAHNFDNHFVRDNYMPDEIRGKTFFIPGDTKREEEIRARLKEMWKGFYEY